MSIWRFQMFLATYVYNETYFLLDENYLIASCPIYYKLWCLSRATYFSSVRISAATFSWNNIVLSRRVLLITWLKPKDYLFSWRLFLTIISRCGWEKQVWWNSPPGHSWRTQLHCSLNNRLKFVSLMHGRLHAYGLITFGISLCFANKWVNSITALIRVRNSKKKKKRNFAMKAVKCKSSLWLGC